MDAFLSKSGKRLLPSFLYPSLRTCVSLFPMSTLDSSPEPNPRFSPSTLPAPSLRETDTARHRSPVFMSILLLFFFNKRHFTFFFFFFNKI